MTKLIWKKNESNCYISRNVEAHFYLWLRNGAYTADCTIGNDETIIGEGLSLQDAKSACQDHYNRLVSVK